jgi:hypothetical protein
VNICLPAAGGLTHVCGIIEYKKINALVEAYARPYYYYCPLHTDAGPALMHERKENDRSGASKNACCPSPRELYNCFTLRSEFRHFSETKVIFSEGITALNFCSTFVSRQKWKKE